MGKRLAALIACVFAAALLAAPTSAQAVENAPKELIVANFTVDVAQDGYWTTDPETGELTVTQDHTAYNVRYDADEGALYLSDATIGKGTVSGGTYSIYAFGESGVSLTIHLAGESHLSSGVPIYVTSDTGDTELNIEGDGKLNAEGTAWGNGGIFLKSGDRMTTGGGSYLNITDGAEVVSNCTNSTAVTFYARPGGEAILTVMDASLTANGWSPRGEARGLFFSRLDGTGTAKFYLRLANNAVVRTNKVAVLSGHTLQHQYDNASGGMCFDGDAGTVYGPVTLQEDLPIGEGETLTIYQGASLTIPEGVSLFNRGTVTGASGSVFNDGTIYNYKGDGATLPSDITGNGTIKNIPTYEFEYPDKLELQDSLGGGNYTSRGTLSLSDDSILGEDGRVVVYATNKGGIELQNENDPARTIPLTVRALNGSSSGYFELDNEARVLAVLDGGQGSTYELQAVAFGTDMKNVPNGTYSGTITLYVGYTKDSAVQFGDTANVDLDTLTPYTVEVTLENALGLSVTSQPQSAGVNEGEAASFSIAAEGGTTRTYQWQVSTDGGTSWDDIDGATDAIYTTPATTIDMDGNQYRCVVTSGRVTIASDPATLTVAHAHKPASDWSNDASCHWHKCEGCAERLDFAVHAPVVEGKQNATCTEDGYTGDTVCSVCGYVMAKGAAIPAAGHNFVDGVCSACGAEDPDYVASEKPKPAGEEKSAPAIPATGDVNTFFSAVPALVGATAVAVGTVLRRRR